MLCALDSAHVHDFIIEWTASEIQKSSKCNLHKGKPFNHCMSLPELQAVASSQLHGTCAGPDPLQLALVVLFYLQLVQKLYLYLCWPYCNLHYSIVCD